jgi:hypothetical protein
MTFQITALPAETFAPLFEMSDAELAERLAVRVVAETSPGYPCRVSLADAEVGDELILVNYAHQTGASPYRATHAVYVRKGVAEAAPAAGEVPQVLRTRTLSLRAFDAKDMIVTADLTEGADLAQALERMLADPSVAYVHIHYAKPGCYAAKAERA